MCDCDCDYDPPSVFRENHVKARKPHKCSECYRVINIGETYRRIFGIWDGRPETFRWCAHCEAADSIVGATVDCHCVLFGGLWDHFRDIATDYPGFGRIYHGVDRQWTYRRGPKKGQLVPIPVAAVTA